MFKFLNIKPEIFGIDINDLALRIVKLNKKSSGFELVSFNEVDIGPGIVKEGVILNEDALSKIIIQACKTVKGRKLDTKYTIVSLPEEKAFSQVIQMPKMTEEELGSAVPFEAENYIPLPIDKVYLDFQTIKQTQTHSKHLDLLLNVMPKPLVDSYMSCFKKAGLIPCILEVESSALIRTFTKIDQKMPLVKMPPVIFVDFGQTKTSLVIYAESSIRFTITVPISSGQITENISKNFGVSLEAADKLKILYDSDLVNDEKSIDLPAFITPVLQDLAAQIKKYINFYHSHSYNEYFPSEGAIAKVILCGGGSKLKKMPEFLSKELNIPVELGDPFLNVVKERSSIFPYNRALSFTTAIGLALRGANDTYLNSYSDTI